MAAQYDAIVIGAGHNGLVAAGYLARARRNVLVLERRERVGGPCGVIEYFPGYTAAITNSPGSLEPKIIADMELEHYGLKFHHPDPSMVMPFPDGRAFVAWRERSRVVDELKKFSHRDAERYYEIFDYVEAFARRLGISLFAPPPTLAEVAARLKTPEDEEAFSKLFFGSIRDFLDDYLESDALKAVIAMVSILSNRVGPWTPGSACLLLHRPLSLASSEELAMNDPRRQVLRGSTGLPMGGMGAIVEAMRSSIEANGATVRTNAPVAEILVRNGKARGVVLESGEEILAPIVISNLAPKYTLLQFLPADSLESDFRTKVEQLKVEGNAFKVGLALDGVPRFAAATSESEVQKFAECQFRISPSLKYLEDAYDDMKFGRPSRGPIIWGLTPSVADPSLAPEGKNIMTLSVFHAPYRLAEGDWKTERDRYGQRIIDTLAEYIPNLKDILVDAKFWSPCDIEDEFGTYEGNITHGDILPQNYFSLRPVPGWSDYRTPVRGVYLCSVGTWPGGNVSGIPGHNAAHQVLRDLATGIDRLDFSGRPGIVGQKKSHLA
ncbi:MAG: NAD(P)/FAD-dependent oxidoreductase [Rhodospirillaceae bacterium]|nr:NAD(P)/FAD-dependent oxidoreductase [Rhodospirillaceae bacterium]